MTPQDDYRLQNCPGPGSIQDIQNNYNKFISKTSYGFTSNGLELLNQSTEAYLYSILGSQARSRQAIINNQTSSFEVQQIFRQIVEDSVINYDASTWINNMNRSISDTNVVLNMVISPSLWLIPSNLIILKNPIVGYNNRLRVANSVVKFGRNVSVNYFGSAHNQPKKVHQEAAHHLETLNDKKHIQPKAHQVKTPQHHLETLDNKKQIEPKKDQKIPQPINNNNNNDLIAIMAVSSISGFLISKYIVYYNNEFILWILT